MAARERNRDARARNGRNLAEKPEPSDGPDQIPEWDSLGALKILLAIEKTYGISVREDQLKAAQSVARLDEIVRTALG